VADLVKAKTDPDQAIAIMEFCRTSTDDLAQGRQGVDGGRHIVASLRLSNMFALLHPDFQPS
jgi:hypothetical protein